MAIDESSTTDVATTDPFRMGVLDAIVGIRSYLETYPKSDLDEAQRVLSRGLASGTGLAYSTAATLLSQNPALIKSIGNDRADTLRDLLYRITLTVQPGWARLTPRGRRYVAAYLPPNAQQCFANAGLMDQTPNEAAMDWWDALANHYRSASDSTRTAVGRTGEKLSLAYETDRLAKLGRPDLLPSWKSIEDNSLGFDLLSFSVDESAVKSRFIEVKACSDVPLTFYISRGEWRAALRLAPDYLFHIWNLTDGSLLELAVGEVEPSVPVDRGDGVWQKLEVTLV